MIGENPHNAVVMQAEIDRLKSELQAERAENEKSVQRAVDISRFALDKLEAERERAGRMREAVKDYLESYGCIGNDFNLERMRKELHEEALRESK